MFEELAGYFAGVEQQWEKMCIRCGGCCGSFDDPCTHLKSDRPGKYYCDIYEKRFGEQVTVGGEKFICVSIRKLFPVHWKNDHLCPYKKINRAAR